jgi:hypothetical protein
MTACNASPRPDAREPSSSPFPKPYRLTGHSYKAEPLSGWANDAYGGPTTHSTPMKFTDDDIISVPIRRPTLSSSPSDPARKKSIFKKLFSSSDDGDVIIKQMTRGEYLKHYAKDEEGMYIGTEDPADDCVLKEGDRRAKHGEGVMVGKWSNEIVVVEEKKERRGWRGRGSGTVIR